MTSIINPETFVANETQPEHGYWVEGTVEVTLRGVTRRVPAHSSERLGLTAYGMTGRYQTGAKAWPAKVTRKIDPRTGAAWDSVSFGRDDRSGKFNKLSNVHFAD